MEQNTAVAKPALDVEDMIDSPEKYGFKWAFGHLHRKGMQITTGSGAPCIEHVDLARMREVFGDEYFLESANGTSARVRDQTIRDAIWDDRSLGGRDKDMKRWILTKALGQAVRTRRTTVVERIVEKRIYLASDGTEFETPQDCLAHNVDLQLASQE